MTDNEIRQALLDARGFAPYSVPDHLVVLRDHVQAADIGAVDRWVAANGGHIDTQPGYQSPALGTSTWQRGPSTPPSDWYVVPAQALGL